MASIEQDDDVADYSTVSTLTRSFEQDGYSNLSDAFTNETTPYLEDSFCESFEDPSVLLDQHPIAKDTLSRRPPMPLPGQAIHYNVNEPLYVNTDNPQQQQSGHLKLDIIQPYSDSDDDDYDDIDMELPAVQEVLGRQRTESDVINIIGSLCLEGVFQGIDNNDDPHNAAMLPSSIRMTDNLVKRGEELDELSVMVTRNLEIVPETPFDANTGTGKSLGLLKTKKHKHSIPKLRLRARSGAQEQPQSSNLNRIDHRPTSVTYYDNIVRPQPLPPLDETLTKNEKKRYKIMESLLESEAAFLTSLNIAIEVYRRGLLVKLQDNNPILDKEHIQSLFGPIKLIQDNHELFYAAISEETKDWSPSKEIGGVFLASFSRNDVIKHYCKYVNNFSNAMSVLETNMKKKGRFLDFLKRQLVQSGTQLSLQALLLKPVQRFPQYLLFLQDLIKYTPSTHEDSVKLQMAQAQIERIAEYLNEAKRSAEQLLIVKYLATKIQTIPFKLTDSIKYLQRQDSIQWVSKKSDGSMVLKRRELLLFDNMLICCASKQRKKSQGNDAVFLFKWGCKISQLQITEPDYANENRLTLYMSSIDQDQETTDINDSVFEDYQKQLYQLDYDFDKLCKIESIVASLYGTYKGITSQEIHNHIRVLQRKLEKVRDHLRNCEPCRVDITIPGRDTTSKSRYHHVLVFHSDSVKKEWLRTVHFTTLKLSQNNKTPWIIEEDDENEFDGEEQEEEDDDSLFGKPSMGFGSGGSNSSSSDYSMPSTVDGLPLVVDQIKLMGYKNDCSSVECATCVGSNRVWLSCSGLDMALIAVVRCLMPTPILVETFMVDCKRIMCMKAIPTTRAQPETSVWASPSGNLNVWLGSSCGKLMIFDAINKTCINFTQLKDAILCIECFKNRAFVGLANGRVEVYTRIKGGQWDLTQQIHRIPLAECPVQCFCPVENELWIGINNYCVILNMETLKMEHSIKVTPETGISVKKLSRSNNGIWMALSRGGTLTLYHKDTRNPIQEIDIQGSLSNIVTCANLTDRFSTLQSISVHVTSLLVSSGYLWVGTSIGVILIYHIPYLQGLPMITGKPYLASDGHTDSVRVLIDVHSSSDIPSARFDQFISDEKVRKIGSFYQRSKQAQQQSSFNETEEKGERKIVEGESDEEKTGLSCSMKIDKNALPMVSDIIKRLEKPKRRGLSPFTSRQKTPAPPKVKPKPSKSISLMNSPPTTPNMSKSDISVISGQDKNDGNTTPTNTGGDGGTQMLSLKEALSSLTRETDTSNIYDQVPLEELTVSMENSLTNDPGEYETPIKSRAVQVPLKIGEYETPVKSCAVINKVPPVKIGEYETPVKSRPVHNRDPPVKTSSSDELESTSDPDINLKRYEGDSLKSLGDGLYDSYKISTISQSWDGHNVFANNIKDGHVFILSGGRGLVNFRPDSEPQQSSILNSRNLTDEAASSIAFQIAK